MKNSSSECENLCRGAGLRQSTSRQTHRRFDSALQSLTLKRSAAGLRHRLKNGPGARKAHAAAHQSIPKQSAALPLAALDRSDRPAQAPRRFLMRSAFQITEHQRRPVFLRQPVYFFVHGSILIAVMLRFDPRCSGYNSLITSPLKPATADDARPQTRRRTAGNLMQPRPDRIAHPERACLAHQHQESRLQCVFRKVLVAQNSQAHSPDHRLVPLDQSRK